MCFWSHLQTQVTVAEDTPLSADSRQGVRWSGRPQAESSSGSDRLHTWLNTTRSASAFSHFFPSHLTVITSSTILSPKEPRELGNLHVNYCKNLVYCHLRQHRCLWKERVRGPQTSCVLCGLLLLIIKLSLRWLQHIHI